MSASDHLQSRQLKMFMTAREITSQYQPADGDRLTKWHGQHEYRPETDDEMWSRKGVEATNDRVIVGHPSLTAALVADGVKAPIPLGREIGRSGKPQVAGGQHRIAAMMDNKPDELMPVVHHTSIGQAKRYGQHRIMKYT